MGQQLSEESSKWACAIERLPWGVNPFEYMTAIMENHENVAKNAAEWMPWNFKNSMANTVSS
jgi:hypothetical protein